MHTFVFVCMCVCVCVSVCVCVCMRVDVGMTLSTPQYSTLSGAVAMVTSVNCLDWLEELLNGLWVPGGNTKPRYRGMPLVILAIDECIEEGVCVHVHVLITIELHV